MLNQLIEAANGFLDNLELVFFGPDPYEPEEITLRTTELPPISDDWDEIDLIPVELPPPSDHGINLAFPDDYGIDLNGPTVELSEADMEAVLDQVFGEWAEEEKRQSVSNPDRLPYDPKEGF